MMMMTDGRRSHAMTEVFQMHAGDTADVVIAGITHDDRPNISSALSRRYIHAVHRYGPLLQK